MPEATFAPTEPPTPEPTATDELFPTPVPTSRSLTRRQAEGELLERASFLTCEPWREPTDQPLQVGAKGAIWCGSPTTRVRQLAIYTFPDVIDLETYWPERIGRIEPAPPLTDGACDDGVAGLRGWANGEIVCYVQDGVAKIRWTDMRTGMYGVLDATDADLDGVYGWWRSNGRRLGRATDNTSSGPVATPRLTIPPTTGEPGQPTSFSCEDGVPVVDPLDRKWKITQVSFRRAGANERVIYHLEREGKAEPAQTSVMVALSDIDDPDLPLDSGVEPPNTGDTALTLYFGPGIRDATGLKHYAPRGVQVVKDLSLYRNPGDFTVSSIGVTGSGCYQLRVPAFEDLQANALKAEIYLDIEP